MNNNAQDDGKKENRQVLEPEILPPDEYGRERDERERNGGNNGGGPRYARFQTFVWPACSVDQNACLAPCISLILFLICLFKFGLLAGIGFLFFHILFSIMGTIRASRRLMLGLPVNVWNWRLGNWVFSFLLTVWLSGGFSN